MQWCGSKFANYAPLYMHAGIMLNAFDCGNAYYAEKYAGIIDSSLACNNWLSGRSGK